MVKGKRLLNAVLAGALCISGVLVTPPAANVFAEGSSTNQITYKLPSNPEKYLFLNVQMVSVANPKVPVKQIPYNREDYLLDMDSGGSYTTKTYYQDNLNFVTSKKGFLWNIYHFIGILQPVYPSNVNLDELSNHIEKTEDYWTAKDLRETRGQIQMNARLQPLIQAGYVKEEEIDDGVATKEFVATVLYRMFGQIRPYHGGIDLMDSENTAVRWAVEVGLPGFVVDSKGYIYPKEPLSMEPGPDGYFSDYAYDRLFHFITLVLPGKKTKSGWEYYRVKLLPGMVPMRAQDIVSVNGKPFSFYDDHSLMNTKEFEAISRQVRQFAVPRFAQMLEQARKDALKPRVWNWSRDVILHPRFSKEIAAYRKNKTNHNLNVIYQAVRKHYNLSIQQDSAANIKSVLDHLE